MVSFLLTSLSKIAERFLVHAITYDGEVLPLRSGCSRGPRRPYEVVSKCTDRPAPGTAPPLLCVVELVVEIL